MTTILVAIHQNEPRAGVPVSGHLFQERNNRPDPPTGVLDALVDHHFLMGGFHVGDGDDAVEVSFEMTVDLTTADVHPLPYTKILLSTEPNVYTYDRRIAKAIPINDREVDLLAKQILRELPSHLKFRDLSKSLWTTRGFRADWGYTLEENFRTTNVRGHPVSVTVEVKAVQMESNPSRYYVAGGSVEGYYHADSKGSPTGYKLHTTLVVRFNSERTPQEFLDNLGKGVYTELRSVLRHEVTHLKDLLLTGPGGQLMSPTDPRAYYNLPGEVRAFMRQVVDEVVAYAHGVGKDDPFFLYLDSKFVERALEKSTTWERVHEALTDENARLIRKAVARALQDVWPELMKLYPLNDE